MVYELYVDSLFLVNFVMNLYLLILVNKSTMRTATRMRIVAGAGVGAVVYVSAFLIGLPAKWKVPFLLVLGSGLMLEITFRPRSLRSIMKLLGRLGCYSFLMGGLFLFVGGISPLFQRMLTRLSGVLGCGAILFLVLGWARERERRKQMDSECRVKLSAGQADVSVIALVDSGNHLTEPISGKPVSVVNPDIFAKLWTEEPQLYRIVPYRSVGQRHGLLKAYCVPVLELEIDGMRKQIWNAYIAVSEEAGATGMLLHPGVFYEAGMKSAQGKERVERYDSKSGNAGKTAV